MFCANCENRKVLENKPGKTCISGFPEDIFATKQGRSPRMMEREITPFFYLNFKTMAKTKTILRIAAVAVILLASTSQEKDAKAKCRHLGSNGTVYVCVAEGDQCRKAGINCPGTLTLTKPEMSSGEGED